MSRFSFWQSRSSAGEPLAEAGLRVGHFKIDSVLAKHSGFTVEELDLLINYDIKYRMGQDAGEDGQE